MSDADKNSIEAVLRSMQRIADDLKAEWIKSLQPGQRGAAPVEPHAPAPPADALREALTDVLALIDEGWLVRSTASDDEPGWAMKQLGPVSRLAKAARALAAPEQPR